MNLAEPIVPKADNTGVQNFMRGFALVAETNHQRQMDELRAKQMVQDAGIAQQKLGLQEQGLDLRQQHYENLNNARSIEQELRRQKLEQDLQHEARVKDVAERTLGLREEQLKLATQKTQDTIEKDRARIAVQRQGLFNSTLKQYGLPYDAFENQQNWKKREDGKYFIEIPVRDKSGAQLYSDEKVKDASGKKVNKPITNFVTIEPETHKWLSETYEDMKGSAGTPRAVEPEPVTRPLDAVTAKALLQQAGGDKAKARQLALDQGYTF